jgi:hypothetical protein
VATKEALANLKLRGTTPVTDKRATVHNSRPENAQRPAVGGGAHTHVRSLSVFVLAQRRTSCGDLGFQA